MQGYTKLGAWSLVGSALGVELCAGEGERVMGGLKKLVEQVRKKT